MSQTKQDRLKKVLKDLAYMDEVANQKDMAAKLKMDNSYLSSMLNGKLPITTRFIENLSNTFGISINWMATGEGHMYTKDEDGFDKPAKESQNKNVMQNNDEGHRQLVGNQGAKSLSSSTQEKANGENPYIEILQPLMPTHSSANGWLPQLSSMNTISQYKAQPSKILGDIKLIETMAQNQPNAIFRIPSLKAEFIITVRERNMQPRYEQGQMLAVKRIEKDDIFPGFPYYVMFTNGECHIYILKPTDNDIIWFESENNTFPAFSRKMEKIDQVYKIMGYIHVESQD